MMRRPAASSLLAATARRSSARADVDQHVEHRARRAAVERTLERADRAGDRAHHVGARARDHAAGERRGVHAVVDHRDPVGVERPGRDRIGLAAVHHVEEVRGQRQVGARRDRLLARARAARARRRWSGSARPASWRRRGRPRARCRRGSARRATASRTPCAARRSAAPSPRRARTLERRLGERAQRGHLARAARPARRALGSVPAPQQVRGLLER